MIRFLLISIVWLTAATCLIASAQESSLTDEQLETKLGSITNPFQSQLPEEEKEEEPVIIEPEISLPEIEVQPEIIEPPVKPKPVEPETVAKPKPTPQPPTPVEPEKPIEPLPELKVTGIIWNSERPQAIINDYVVDIGDMILDIKITDIQKTGVTGEFHGRDVTIKTQRSQL